MTEERNIIFDGYLDVVNEESLEPLLRESFKEEPIKLEGLVRVYILSKYGNRSYKTRIKDVFNDIWAFNTGYKIAKGIYDVNNLKNITDDGVEWTYDSQVNLSIIDEILEAECFHLFVNEDGTPEKSSIIALDKTRSHCMDLMSRKSYTARAIASIAQAYFQGYWDCLVEQIL